MIACNQSHPFTTLMEGADVIGLPWERQHSFGAYGQDVKGVCLLSVATPFTSMEKQSSTTHIFCAFRRAGCSLPNADEPIIRFLQSGTSFMKALSGSQEKGNRQMVNLSIGPRSPTRQTLISSRIRLTTTSSFLFRPLLCASSLSTDQTAPSPVSPA